MTYYSKEEYKLIKYEKSKVKGKQYAAILENNKTKKKVRVNFGSMMENYRDLTGLNLYPHLIHGDLKRRKSFRARMKGFIKEGYYSPSFFSYHILW